MEADRKTKKIQGRSRKGERKNKEKDQRTKIESYKKGIGRGKEKTARKEKEEDRQKR